jgi:hypothetical protein
LLGATSELGEEGAARFVVVKIVFGDIVDSSGAAGIGPSLSAE